MEDDEVLNSLTSSKEVKLYYKGKLVLDSKLAKVLEEVERKGSLLAACKSQGLSYSGVWKRIDEVENLLGRKILIAQRGGTGGGWTALTDFGRKLLIRYYELAEEHVLRPGDVTIYSGYDPIFEDYVKKRSGVRAYWVGSLAGLSFMMMGQADIAGVSLYDPDTGRCTIPFLQRFWLEGEVIVIRGYQREVGFVYREGVKVNSMADVIEKGLRFVNRTRGSSTRLLVDRLIREAALEKGEECDTLHLKVKGYDQEVRTHIGVAKKISKGDADVGISLRYIAEIYRLNFTPISWEVYDFVVTRRSLRKPFIQSLMKFLSGEELSKMLEVPGYRRLKDTGKVIYP